MMALEEASESGRSEKDVSAQLIIARWNMCESKSPVSDLVSDCTHSPLRIASKKGLAKYNISL
jgi:hypothetical protein